MSIPWGEGRVWGVWTMSILWLTFFSKSHPFDNLSKAASLWTNEITFHLQLKPIGSWSQKNFLKGPSVDSVEGLHIQFSHKVVTYIFQTSLIKIIFPLTILSLFFILSLVDKNRRPKNKLMLYCSVILQCWLYKHILLVYDRYV